MKVSVVIPTFNGANRISTVLKSLEKQTQLPDETIVVIDGSTDNTKLILETWSSLPGLRFIGQKNKGRSGARNEGAKSAKGEVLLFFDDDIHIQKDCITAHIHLHQKFSDSIVAGQIFESTEIKTEFTAYKAYLTKLWTKDFSNEPTRLNADNLFLSAANMSMTKKVWSKLGGFDISLNDAEDFELAVRAFQLDIPIYFSPNLIGHHHSFDNFADYIKRQRQYRQAHKLLQTKHPSSGLMLKYNVPLSNIKKLAYGFVSPRFVNLADSDFFRFIPKTIRFGIYKRMVSALTVYYPNKKL